MARASSRMAWAAFCHASQSGNSGLPAAACIRASMIASSLPNVLRRLI